MTATASLLRAMRIANRVQLLAAAQATSRAAIPRAIAKAIAAAIVNPTRPTATLARAAVHVLAPALAHKVVLTSST